MKAELVSVDRFDGSDNPAMVGRTLSNYLPCAPADQRPHALDPQALEPSALARVADLAVAVSRIMLRYALLEVPNPLRA